MYDMNDLYDELACIASQIDLLSCAVTKQFIDACGRWSGNVIQEALCAVSQHLTRITESIDPANCK